MLKLLKTSFNHKNNINLHKKKQIKPNNQKEQSIAYLAAKETHSYFLRITDNK